MFKNTPVYELAIAVKHNNASKIEQLIRMNKFDLEYKVNYYKLTMLSLAAIHHKTKAVQTLLKYGANPNSTNWEHKTILMLLEDRTIGGCDTEMIGLLIRHGADVNEVTNFDTFSKAGYPVTNTHTTALCEASEWNCFKKVKQLIKYGADPNLFAGDSGNCAITSALMQDNIEIAKYLLIDCKAKIPNYCMIRSKKDTVRILNMLKMNTFKIGSKNHKIKMEIVKYLKDNYGLDYFKTETPNFILRSIKSRYPRNWEKYLKKY